MSDSELSDVPSTDLPPSSEIQATLQEQVKTAAKGPLEDYTVSKIRKAVEERLGLRDGFFKADEEWKARSKKIIEEQVAKESEAGEAETKINPKPKAKKASAADGVSKKTAKRSSIAEKPRPRKKQKVDSDEETSALSSPPSDLDEEKDTPKRPKNINKPAAPKTQKKTTPKSKPERIDADEEELEDVQNQDENGSGSELSVVLDEAPIKKQRGKSKGAEPVDKQSKASQAKPKTPAEVDPDQEEIKKLQGWLVKCGIRKVWGKELKPYGSSKAKIKHLRGMLTDAGMTGRYSNEKAAQIKEARELAADIEAVQEGNERWGKDGEDDDDGDDKTRGGRRLVRGAKNYDFLSSDGEETD